MKNNSYFENNIIFIPAKVAIKTGYFIQTHKEFISYTLDSYYKVDKINNNDEDQNILGLFNLYLNNKILNYEIIITNLIDILSHLGGIVKILFFIFEFLNCLNHRYTIIQNTKDLFKINSGIETDFFGEKDDINFDNMRYVTTKNYKIKQLNTNDEMSRNFSPILNKRKIKATEPSSKPRLSNKKNNVSIYPINMGSNKKNNLAKINTNSINKNYDKRKSYLSRGNHGKSKENKDNSSFIKNKNL